MPRGRPSGRTLPDVAVAGAWHDEPAFVAALAGRLSAALAGSRPDEREARRSCSRPTACRAGSRTASPDYLAQLRATAEAVAAAAGLAPERWTFCWQSAGHEPGEWMKPDFADLMPEIAATGGRSVLVAPVQFLADHLEILYDIDVGAREQAVASGLAFHRIESLNADPGLVDALASVARRTLEARPGGCRAAAHGGRARVRTVRERGPTPGSRAHHAAVDDRSNSPSAGSPSCCRSSAASRRGADAGRWPQISSSRVTRSKPAARRPTTIRGSAANVS